MTITYHRQNGVALVITLLMLSVITFLTVAFLISSRRDRASVHMAMTATDARFASDHGMARAQSEVASRIMARTNRLASDLLVSRAYVNPRGFDRRLPGVDFENVNYDYNTELNPLSGDDLVRNIGNLFYDPRPPVFVRTNSDPSAPLDFRFYLDINRNQRFEPTGFLPALDDRGEMIPDGNGGFLTNYFVGDPEWIGIKARPGLPHSPTNRFIARYAFLALPAGNTLDLNFIHNFAKGVIGLEESMREDGFQRHQGYGSWEINLAAFLQTWNPNPITGYGNSLYQYNLGQDANMGPAFRDALGFLRHRYGGSLENLDSVENLFGQNGVNFFVNDRIDGYASQPILGPPYSYLPGDPDPDEGLTGRPWPGSFQVNYFHDMQELFDPNRVNPAFVETLSNTVARANSFDRYAFSRLLSQVGTHSAPNVRGKVHINFRNDPNLNSLPTTFEEWTPVGFFTNAADRLIRAHLSGTELFGRDVGNNFALTNIQIYPTNQYSAELHRLLQVAANIYDATTNRADRGLTNYPTVFQPVFNTDRNTGQVWISGYREVERDSEIWTGPWVDIDNPGHREMLQGGQAAMVHGIPLVIGAKKGLPNFNEFTLISAVSVTRKLQFAKRANARPHQTNQMYILDVSNIIGMEAWNSYAQTFERPVEIVFTNMMTTMLTNRTGVLRRDGTAISNVWTTGFRRPINRWPGAPLIEPSMPGATTNFFTGTTNRMTLPPARYLHNHTGFSSNTNIFEAPGNRFPVPEWTLVVSNRLMYAMVDQATGRILDFVNVAGEGAVLDINEELNNVGGNRDIDNLWVTNRVPFNATAENYPTVGIRNQINISRGDSAVTDAEWDAYTSVSGSRTFEIKRFSNFLNNAGESRGVEEVRNAPFQPTVTFIHRRNYQANDPLVHYTLADLINPRRHQVTEVVRPPVRVSVVLTNSPAYNIGKVNNRYMPWNFHPADRTRTDMLFKDPRVRRSDDWQFPTNKFPNIGWLGRVHRGTPWQTVYLKPDAPEAEREQKRRHWAREWVNSAYSYPTSDWRLLDLFTVAPHDNAARGLLSVNQTNVAAWAAVLSGTLVTTNPAVAAFPLPPDSVSGTNYIARMVAGINRERNARDNQVFGSIGEVLAAPELTTASPFFLEAENPELWTDADVERIPQQIMSLLQVGEPRYVIYAFGQALRPAERAFVLNPPPGRPDLQNLVTNYQVTGEFVSRAVVRFDGPPDAPRAVIENYKILPPQ